MIEERKGKLKYINGEKRKNCTLKVLKRSCLPGTDSRADGWKTKRVTDMSRAHNQTETVGGRHK